MIRARTVRTERVFMKALSCVLAVIVAGAVVQAQNVNTLHTEVKTTVDKKIDFKSFKTYSWEKGQVSADPAAHKSVVAAVEAELAALGLTRLDAKGDVLVRYHAVARTDVDLKSKKNDGARPTSDVGKVQVELLGGKSFKRVWQATTEERLSRDPAARDTDIRRAIARLFTAYPGRKPA
jgi:hypothetical protein